MKQFAKIALGALMVAGAATAVASQPAEARVSVGIGIGPAYGGYYGPPARYTSCDPYSRYYDPYACGYRSYGPAYYGAPLSLGFGFYGGGGYHGGGHGGGSYHGGGHSSGHGGGGHHR